MPAIAKGKTEEGDKTVLHVEMTGEPSPCPSCGSSEVVGFGKRTQSVADIPENGKPVVLQVITRRFRCKNCGRSFYESVEGVGGNRRMTDRLRLDKERGSFTAIHRNRCGKWAFRRHCQSVASSQRGLRTPKARTTQLKSHLKGITNKITALPHLTLSPFRLQFLQVSPHRRS